MRNHSLRVLIVAAAMCSTTAVTGGTANAAGLPQTTVHSHVVSASRKCTTVKYYRYHARARKWQRLSTSCIQLKRVNSGRDGATLAEPGAEATATTVDPEVTWDPKALCVTISIALNGCGTFADPLTHVSSVPETMVRLADDLSQVDDKTWEQVVKGADGESDETITIFWYPAEKEILGDVIAEGEPVVQGVMDLGEGAAETAWNLVGDFAGLGL